MAHGHLQPNVVFFDLETTGFDRPIRPVQIGAIDSWGQNSFDEFIWPRRDVHRKATRVNGFEVFGNELYREGEGPLETVDLADALQDFMDWLDDLGGNVILVAHKCRDFDAKVLLRNLEEFGIRYEDTIMGFSDSLLASRLLYPEVESHRLSAMLEEMGLPPCRDEHDALSDAEDCRRITRHMAWEQSMKFTKMICNPDWYMDLAEQWDWTFPEGYVTY